MLGSIASAQSTLQSIQIDANDFGRQITLKTTTPLEIVKHIKNDNLIILDLKNATIKDAVSTVYNDVYDVKNVIVKQISKDNLQLTIEGDSIAKAGIVVEPSSSASSDSITLNRPVSEYQNVVSLDNSEEESLGLFSGLTGRVFDFHKMKNTLVAILHSFNFEGLIYIFVFVSVIVFGNRFLKSSDNKTQVGLSGNCALKTTPKIRHSSLLNFASSQEPKKKSAFNVQSSKSLYGLNSYKQSQKNPYTESASTSSRFSRIAPSSVESGLIKNNFVTKRQPLHREKNESLTFKNSKQAQKSSFTTDALTKTKNVSDLKKSKPIEIDSRKFLESMSKIYERNGRADLAVGLKNNIKKIRQENRETIFK